METTTKKHKWFNEEELRGLDEIIKNLRSELKVKLIPPTAPTAPVIGRATRE